ncbi:MAG: ABC transporter permease [Calditrichaeota bacterium]|nr:ABC transporter permease [Calditrichota bacterium]
MLTRSAIIIFLKELKDILRDRRTVISMTVIPILMMPVLIIGMALITTSAVKSVMEKPSRVIWLGTEAAEIKTAVSQAQNLQLLEGIPDSASAVKLIREKEADAAVIAPDGFDNRLNNLLTGDGGDAPALTLLEDKSRERSSFAAKKIVTAIDDSRSEIVSATLKERGIKPQLFKPFVIDRQNIKTEEEMGRFMASTMLPYFIILMLFTGAISPAADLTAGEKERMTLETLLVSGVSRTDIIIGKFLTVLLASVVSLVLSIGSFAFMFIYGFKMFPELMKDVPMRFNFVVDFTTGLAALATLLPLAIIVSAVLMTICLFAKSYREAQSYTSPLMIVVIFPAIMSLMPGIELNLSMALIPVVNVSLSLKQIFAGVVDMKMLLVASLENLGIAAVCIYIMSKMFRKETVLFRV